MQKPSFQPESLMMSYAYQPEWSGGAIKCPIFQTSTFAFQTAEQGKRFFEVSTGKREPKPDEKLGLIYSRLNHPNLQVLEKRLCLWDGAEEAAVFESGMAAISTVLLEFLKPGDLVVHSRPLYGGTDYFVHHFLDKLKVASLGFKPGEEQTRLPALLAQENRGQGLAMIYIETPANPTNDIIDIAACKKVAEAYSTAERQVIIVVDNTYMGPLWQHPLEHGADIVLYSATKYIGGHSDLVAGAVLGSSALLKRVKELRTFLGGTASAWTSWLLLRSLETLKLRMEQQQHNAAEVAAYLQQHDKIEQVNYLGLLEKSHPSHAIYEKQYKGSGAMLSFYIKGGEAEAFRFLNALKLVHLAVSLGSTESLAQHPKTMTHAGVDPEDLAGMQISDSLIRLSVGVENVQDILWDIEQALREVDNPKN